MNYKDIRTLHAQGLNDTEIAGRLGLPFSSVNYARREVLGLPANANRGSRTQVDVDMIRTLHAQGLDDTQIAKEMGFSPVTIGEHRRKLRLKAHRKSRQDGPRRYYFVYEAKTDKLLAYGTAKECAAQLGVTLDSFYCTVSRAQARVRGRYEIFIDDVDDEGMED